MKKIIPILITVFLFCNILFGQNFRTGDEVLIDSLYLLQGKNIGIITNSTGLTGKGKHIITELLEKKVTVKRIFTPEHGFYIDDGNAESFSNIEIISLYGNSNKINVEYLKDIDILIYDIQDLGVRFYTYTSTLYLTMKDAVNSGTEYIICDRPSVADLNYIGGYFLDNNYSSFVGIIPVPVVYGMTTGELGLYLQQYFSSELGKLNLKVMKMQGYTRQSDFEKLHMKWINPSPNIRTPEAGRLYSALCFLEGTNISEGRGTDNPFTLFGAPFCNPDEIITELKKYNFEGIEFEPVEFTPESTTSYSAPKYENEKCYGVRLIFKDYKKFTPMELSVAVLITLKKLYPAFQWTKNNFIDKLAGTDRLRKNINNGMTVNEIINDWNEEVKEFNFEREKILLYSN
jgi:uncharacterized protein YbbC (DUF1343 family)